MSHTCLSVFLFIISLVLSSFFEGGDRPNSSELNRGLVDIKVSGNGKYLLVVSENGDIRIVDTKSKAVVRSCSVKKRLQDRKIRYDYRIYPAMKACFSDSDGKSVYFGTALGLFEWKWHNNEIPRIIISWIDQPRSRLLRFPAENLAISNDGKYLAVSDFLGNVAVILTKDHKIAYQTEAKMQDIKMANSVYLNFSGDSNFFYFNAETKLVKYDLMKKTKRSIGEIQRITTVDDFVVSDSSKYMAVSTSDGRIYCCSLKDPSKVLIEGSGEPPIVCAISEKARVLVTGTGNGQLTTYSLSDGKIVGKEVGPATGFVRIGFLNERVIFGIGETPAVLYFRMMASGKIIRFKS